MEETFQALTKRLLQKNSRLSVARARTWVELLWEDFEATYAKAGYEYQGKERTEKMVTQLIDSYGANLHEFAARNPKYKHLLDDSNDLTH
ncbi:YfhJ family protein [Domibacillus sp. 8LH]|jgi:WVELL protein|uniref:YfhJ family protein n=1 Tax=unclassified Domibacillus TaxID=2632383 RepID=UPI0028E75B53|nr:YfhJ family protein [Domibacillus sp. DTU_2020_1001157_1_SI_ALB_TIR_016]WNS80148.1 YfhJ family protein [Domibacillus sp. DTU_2020_1001157_1_SI_ALB_TIR_016]